MSLDMTAICACVAGYEAQIDELNGEAADCAAKLDEDNAQMYDEDYSQSDYAEDMERLTMQTESLERGIKSMAQVAESFMEDGDNTVETIGGVVA